MLKSAAGVVLVAVATGIGLSLYLDYRNDLQAENAELSSQVEATQQQAAQQAQRVANTSNNSSYNTLEGRKHRIKADNRGHFLATARMNGRPVEVLVDTGATSVAINRSTARRLGIRLSPSDFKHQVNTANGVAKAASAEIERIQIGRVSATNVRVLILPDRSLSGTLLGMSFLNEMRSFEIRNGELVLTQ